MENNQLNSPEKTLNEDTSFFSVFSAPIQNTTPLKSVTLKDVHKVITSTKYQVITEQLRAALKQDDDVTYKQLKNEKLDYCSFSGTFSRRSVDALLKHSGLLCIDLDDLEDVADTKNKILEQLPPVLAFTSPSGNGLKVVFKIDISEATHEDYYFAFEDFFKKHLNLITDPACKDISRACYLCHDANAYLCEDAPIFDQSFIDYNREEESPKIAAIPPLQPITDHSIIIAKLKEWIQAKVTFVSGQRNKYVTLLAGAYNRFGIPEDIAKNDLFILQQTDFTEAEIKATIESIYRRTELHHIAAFDLNKPFTFDLPDALPVAQSLPLMPIDGFPEFIQAFINEYTEVYRIPRDYIAASVIISTALAIGDKLELKDKYTNVPILWLAIIGDVSTGKSEPLRKCLSYFEGEDKRLHVEYMAQLAEYEIFKSLSSKEKKAVNKVEKPRHFNYILKDYTPEALADAHAVNERGLLIYRDELKGWLDDFDRYNKSGAQSVMLSTFYRDTWKVNRAGKDPLFIAEPCILIAGGIQPDLLKDLASENRAESGFLSRFIFVYPDNAEKQHYRPSALKKETHEDFMKYLHLLNTIPGKVPLSLTHEAKEQYRDWFNKNADLTNDAPNGYIKGVYGKFDVIVLRLAIVLHGMYLVCEQSGETEISGDTMSKAIDLIEYFRLTAHKVYRKIFQDAGDKKISKVEVIKMLASGGASQNEIAAAIKVSQQYVQKILKNN